MRRAAITIVSLFIFGMTFSSALAGSFTFTPYDTGGTRSDIFDLDHNYLYLWSIDATMSLEQSNLKNALDSGEKILSASISITNIYNWDYKEYALKFFLLDNVKKSDVSNRVDLISIVDNQYSIPGNEIPFYDDSNPNNTLRKFQAYEKLTEVKYTPGQGTTPTPIPGPNNKTYDFQYDFNAEQLTTLAQYINTKNVWRSTTYNSTFGIGFDPDCHFYNDGISLTIVTAHAPEPATMLLFGAGIAGLGSVARRKKAC